VGIKLYRRRISKENELSNLSWPLNASVRIIFCKLQVQANLIVCFQIWTAATLTYKQKNVVSFGNFFSKDDFCTITPHFLKILFRKCSATFHCNWILQSADRFFSPSVRKLRNKLNKRTKKKKHWLVPFKTWFGR